MGGWRTRKPGPEVRPGPGRLRAGRRGKEAATTKPRRREPGVKDKTQKRLSSLLVLATFVGLQVPLKKRFVAEQIPGNRGGKEDAAEALVQGAARMAAVILASTAVRVLSGGGLMGNRRGSGDDGAAGKGGEEQAETRLKVILEPAD